MKINRIVINNYRLLKDFSLDLERDLSLIIGKNNTGKTSILSVIEKFLNSTDLSRFSNDDFNLNFKESLKESLDGEALISDGIKLYIYIDYEETDDLSNISKVMMDLDPDNNMIVLGFEYILSESAHFKFKSDYKGFLENENTKKHTDNQYKPKDFNYFFKHNYSTYFKHFRKSIKYNHISKEIDLKNTLDLDKEKINIRDIINFKYVSAKRDVANKDSNKTLSKQTSSIYRKSEDDAVKIAEVEKFKDQLAATDDKLSNIYKELFSNIITKISDLGGMKCNESIIDIVSTLQHKELLEGNTTVVYSHDGDNKLPEHYNGLGYMNLISMIFELEILIKEFEKGKNEKPSDINLLFIEEPEAHTHPQMQCVFIKNIKKLLGNGITKTIARNGEDPISIERKLQYIISTHSSHIVKDSDFNDIKYIKKKNRNESIAKNLKDLEKEYESNGEEENYRFLRQYLTLNRSELFFADKAIFIEGDTERILLPAMMKKIDTEYPDNPLISQNISIVEVGSYANIFERFINLIGVKSLIITDIDSTKRVISKDHAGNPILSKKGKIKYADCLCRVSEGENTSNPTLNFFFKEISFERLRELALNKKRFIKKTNWKSHHSGIVQICYQTLENGYCGRSFEDAFFCIPKNKLFIKNNLSSFKGLKNKKLFFDSSDAWELAQCCIDSKGTFAIDILLLSAKNDFEDWDVPAYIKEGLVWLKQD